MYTIDLAFASGTFTQSGQPSATNTVVIGGVTYTFQSAAITEAGQVQIGDDAEESQDNLIAAINGTDGVNTPNPHARAVKSSATVFVAHARVGGLQGTFIATTDTHANGSWGAAAMAEGTGDLGSYLEELLDLGEPDSEQYQGLAAALFDRS